MWSGLPGIAWYWTGIIWYLAASIWYFAWIASWFMIFFQDCLIIGQDCMKGHQLEVEAQRAPRLLVWAYLPSGSCHQGMSGASSGHVWGIICVMSGACVWSYMAMGPAHHCTMCTLDSFFSFRPRAVGHIVQPRDRHIIEHIWKYTLEKSRTNATSVSLAAMIQVLWGLIWNYTVEKSQTNATSATTFPLKQSIWGHI